MNLTKELFEEKVSEMGGDFKFKGDKPVMIDFAASWCGPCKMIAPIVEELATEYDGKIDIYTVDVDQESELAGAFGVSSVPSLAFIPVDKDPSVMVGAFPKEKFQEIFKKEFDI